MRKELIQIICCFVLVSTNNHAFADAAAIQILCDGDERSADIHLTIEKPLRAKVELSSDHSEVLFTFNGEFILRGNKKIANCSPVLQNVQNGFNKLLISGISGSYLTTTKFPNGYGIEILATPRPQEFSPQNVQLALERARLLYKQGNIEASIQELDRALERNPNNADLLMTIFSYRAAAGDQRGAAHAAVHWAELEPKKANANSPYKQLIQPYRPRVGASYESIDAGDSFRESRYTVNGSYPINQAVPGDTISIKAQENDAFYHNIVNPSGELANVYPNTHRFEVAYQHPFEHDGLELALTAADYTFGGHGNYEIRDLSGATNIKFGVSEPNWDYASAVAFEGEKSHLGISRQQRINSQLNVSGDVAQNFFSLQDANEVARSLSLTGNLAWTVIDGETPLNFNYTFDGDYFNHIESEPDQFGTEQPIFSGQDNEFHVLTLGSAKTISFNDPNMRPFSIYGFGGYSFNRLGPDSPQIGGGIRGGWWKGAEFSIEAGRSFSTTVGANNTQNRILASINWSM